MTYAHPPGGLPAQSALMTQRAVFTEAYAVIPAACQTDIVTSLLPTWLKTRLWVLARPLSGFAETFSHYLMEVEQGGGSRSPDNDPAAQSILFVTQGNLRLQVGDQSLSIAEGGYAYIPPGSDWSAWAIAERGPTRFHWIRKIWEPAEGVAKPRFFTARDQDIAPTPMPGTQGRWATTRFVDPSDISHDCHVNIVTFQPGGTIPFEETHVMEHGLYVLQGKATYRLNRDWVEVGPGDYMWLRAFCPQACYAGGDEPFRYLLYKDVNRHARLRGAWSNRGIAP
jgi:(S)-ureidoglycine aminohydrolase